MMSLPRCSSRDVVSSGIDADYSRQSIAKGRRIGLAVRGLFQAGSKSQWRSSAFSSAASASIESSKTICCDDNDTSSLAPTIIDQPLPVKSILKTGSSERVVTVGKRKSVHFKSRSQATVHRVDSFQRFASDLWWSKDEMRRNKEAQSDMTKEKQEVQLVARDYLLGIERGRKQVITDQNYDRAVEGLENSYISEEYYKKIVAGRINGNAGLEVFTDSHFDYRRKERLIVANIVYQYSNLLQSCTTQSEVDYKLCSYARSFSLPNRSWARVLGNADRDAVIAE